MSRPDWRAEIGRAALARADAALAAQGRGPCVKQYWQDGGWYVTDRPHALVPEYLGDRHWKCRIMAEPGEGYADLQIALNARAAAGGEVRPRGKERP